MSSPVDSANVERPRRLRRRFAALSARAFSRFVAGSSPERLEKLMQGKARRPLLRRIFRTIPLMVRGQGPTSPEVAEFRIRGARDGGSDVWQLWLIEDRCEVSRGSAADPRVSLEFDPVAFLQMAAGLRSGPELFIQGRVKVEGDLMLGARLPARFVFPSPRKTG